MEEPALSSVQPRTRQDQSVTRREFQKPRSIADIFFVVDLWQGFPICVPGMKNKTLSRTNPPFPVFFVYAEDHHPGVWKA
jgi:hypothetical protein